MSAPCPKEPAHEARSAMWDENLSIGSACGKRLADKVPDNRVGRVPFVRKCVF